MPIQLTNIAVLDVLSILYYAKQPLTLRFSVKELKKPSGGIG
jgi:hypothetical protein